MEVMTRVGLTQPRLRRSQRRSGCGPWPFASAPRAGASNPAEDCDNKDTLNKPTRSDQAHVKTNPTE